MLALFSFPTVTYGICVSFRLSRTTDVRRSPHHPAGVCGPWCPVVTSQSRDGIKGAREPEQHAVIGAIGSRTRRNALKPPLWGASKITLSLVSRGAVC